MQNWFKNLFEGMALAVVHNPSQNSMPPDIGTHSYRDKPYKRIKGAWYN